MTTKRKAPQPLPGLRAPHTGTSLTSSVAFKLEADKDTPALQGALAAVRRGWAVLPLIPGGKEPYGALLPRDRHGDPSWRLLAVTPATEDEVRGWFQKDSAANYGVILSGLAVVDVDGEHPRHLHLAPTAVTRTRRGGHYFYRTSRPLSTLKLPWGELRSGEGSYVVGAGSLHPSGARYEWADFCNPDEIGITDLPADLLQVAEEEHQQQRERRSHPPHRAGTGSNKKYITDCFPAAPSPSTFDYSEWATREDVALSILKACGVANPRLKKAFKCILPGHDDHRASASLYRLDNHVIVYRDWHEQDGAAWYTLGEVYASVRSGRATKCGAGEKIIWFVRALIHCGYLKPPAIWAPRLPADVTPVVRDVFEGFRELVACRHIYQNGDPGGTMFSWRFAAAWCKRGERQAGQAVGWLLREGYLRQMPGTGGIKRAATMFVIGSLREDGGNRD